MNTHDRPTLTDLVTRWWRDPEPVGDANCPLIWRWMITKVGEETPDETLNYTSTHQRKLMLHHFVPDTEDLDPPHDHPWPFWTLVVWGRYEDIQMCGRCHGMGDEDGADGRPCQKCGGTGVGRRVWRRAPSLRRRGPGYAHVTRTDHRGAWTLVLTGRARQRWGFWRDGKHWFYKDYEARWDYVMRCDEDADA